MHCVRHTWFYTADVPSQLKAEGQRGFSCRNKGKNPNPGPVYTYKGSHCVHFQ